MAESIAEDVFEAFDNTFGNPLTFPELSRSAIRRRMSSPGSRSTALAVRNVGLDYKIWKRKGKPRRESPRMRRFAMRLVRAVAERKFFVSEWPSTAVTNGSHGNMFVFDVLEHFRLAATQGAAVDEMIGRQVNITAEVARFFLRNDTSLPMHIHYAFVYVLHPIASQLQQNAGQSTDPTPPAFPPLFKSAPSTPYGGELGHLFGARRARLIGAMRDCIYPAYGAELDFITGGYQLVGPVGSVAPVSDTIIVNLTHFFKRGYNLTAPLAELTHAPIGITSQLDLKVRPMLIFWAHQTQIWDGDRNAAFTTQGELTIHYNDV